jgi:hypothetical protein
LLTFAKKLSEIAEKSKGTAMHTDVGRESGASMEPASPSPTRTWSRRKGRSKANCVKRGKKAWLMDSRRLPAHTPVNLVELASLVQHP